MTTFQSIIYAITQGISEFLPISAKAHHILLPYLIGWQAPLGGLTSALALGTLFALFFYFRHDWASMISCFLQVLIYRKRPMTLDERLPLFIGISTLPIIGASYYFHDRIAEVDWSPLLVCGVFAAAGLPIWAFDSWSRKTKGMFDWNGLDAAWIGIIQASALIPGWDPFTAVLVGALSLNYKRETAVKYAYFSIAPMLIVHALSGLREVSFHSASPMPDFSWLSFGVALVVTFFASLLAIGGFIKHVQQKGLGHYVIYRWILAAGVLTVYWIRSR